MGQVIADVTKYPSAEHSCSRVPVVEEDGMSKFVEGSRKGDEESRGHD